MKILDAKYSTQGFNSEEEVEEIDDDAPASEEIKDWLGFDPDRIEELIEEED